MEKKTEKDGYFSTRGARRKKTEKVWYSNESSLTPLVMNTADILEFVDEALNAKTGKHLNDLQRKIIEGILN
ncbi:MULTISPECIES: hypothetical protein [unclassified Microcoleus]|uniref:hypothetical protein n=1 Tax=unclassified Microcoleus TaxID=2642155 RepID=UPI002D80C70C|nr:hypothetical protein [Microcoleus sp. PH2017_28_MFU_U_A]